jgi:hypothetical protein
MQDTQVLPTGRRRKEVFAENPLGFGRFRGKIKNSSLLQDLTL